MAGSFTAGTLRILDTSVIPSGATTSFTYQSLVSISYKLPSAINEGFLATDINGNLSWNTNSSAQFGVEPNLASDQLLVINGGNISSSRIGIGFDEDSPTITSDLRIANNTFRLTNAVGAVTPATFLQVTSATAMTIGSANTTLKIGLTGFANGTRVVGVDANGNMQSYPLSTTYANDSVVRRGGSNATAVVFGALESSTFAATGLITAGAGMTITSGTLSTQAISATSLVISGSFSANTLSTAGVSSLFLESGQSGFTTPTVSIKPSAVGTFGSLLIYNQAADAKGGFSLVSNGLLETDSSLRPTAATLVLGGSDAANQWLTVHSRGWSLYDSAGANAIALSHGGAGIFESNASLRPTAATLVLGGSAAANQWATVHSRGWSLYDSAGANAIALSHGGVGIFETNASLRPAAATLSLGGTAAANQWLNVYSRGLTIYTSAGASGATLTRTADGLVSNTAFIPDSNGSRGLGVASVRWQNGYINAMNVTSLNISGQTASRILQLDGSHNVVSSNTLPNNSFSTALTITDPIIATSGVPDVPRYWQYSITSARFRVGSNPTVFSGICLSYFDALHMMMRADANGFSIGYTNTNAAVNPLVFYGNSELAATKVLDINTTGQIQALDGTNTAPSYSFTNYKTSGMYAVAANDIRLVTETVHRIRITSANTIISNGVILSGADMAEKFVVQDNDNVKVFVVDTLSNNLKINGNITISGSNSATKFVIRDATPASFFTVDSSSRRLTITGSQNSAFIGLIVENVNNTSIAATATIRMQAASAGVPYTTYAGNVLFNSTGFTFDRDVGISALTNTGPSFVTTDAAKRLLASAYSSLFPYCVAQYYATPTVPSNRSYASTLTITNADDTQMHITDLATSNTNTSVTPNFTIVTASDNSLFDIVTGLGPRYIGPTNPNINFHISLSISIGTSGSTAGVLRMALGINNVIQSTAQKEVGIQANNSTVHNGTIEFITTGGITNNLAFSLYIRTMDNRSLRINNITFVIRGIPFAV